MTAEQEERTRTEVRDAYASVTRLRVYMRLVLMISAMFFLAVAGGMIVGWFPLDEGVLGLVSAVLIGTVSAAKFYDGVHRTTLYAMDVERTLPGQESQDTSSVTRQSLKAFTAVALALTLMTGAGIVAYSVANADTQQPVTSLSQVFVTEDERDDDDDDGDSEDGDSEDGDSEDGDSEESGTDTTSGEDAEEAGGSETGSESGQPQESDSDDD